MEGSKAPDDVESRDERHRCTREDVSNALESLSELWRRLPTCVVGMAPAHCRFNRDLPSKDNSRAGYKDNCNLNFTAKA